MQEPHALGISATHEAAKAQRPWRNTHTRLGSPQRPKRGRRGEKRRTSSPTRSAPRQDSAPAPRPDPSRNLCQRLRGQTRRRSNGATTHLVALGAPLGAEARLIELRAGCGRLPYTACCSESHTPQTHPSFVPSVLALQAASCPRSDARLIRGQLSQIHRTC